MNGTNETTTEEMALAYADQRKRTDEVAFAARCPCCNNFIAIYLQQSARQELVPDTIDAMQLPLPV